MNEHKILTQIEAFCKEARGRFTIHTILACVCASLLITPDQIRETDKIGWCLDARRIFCYLSRKLTNNKWEAISLEIDRNKAQGAFKLFDAAETRLKDQRELFTEKTLLVIESLKKQS